VVSVSLLTDIDVRLELLGQGDAVKELKALSRDLAITDKVKFLDTIRYDKVPKWINSGHVGILPFPDWPGWNTSSPIKLFEYLACGKPIIVSNIPAHLDVLKDQEFVFWAGDGSPECLAEAIRLAYRTRDQLRELGNKARDYVVQHYTWKKQSNKLAEFLNHVIASNSH
jgi:glycosyltransferase involved in cell wall biosynthesis